MESSDIINSNREKMIKILFASENLYPPIGGADITLYTLMNKLKEKGFDVYSVYAGKKVPNSKIKLYPIRMKRLYGQWINLFIHLKKWRKKLYELTKDINPDIIVTWDTLIPITAEIAIKLNKPYIILLRSYTHLSLDGFESKYSKEAEKFRNYIKFFVQKPFFDYFMKLNKKAFASTKYIYVNSKYLSKLTEKYYNKKVGIINTFVNFNDYKVKKNTKEYITYIGSSYAKGVEIFIEIAKSLPNKKFLVAGSYHHKIKNLPNVKYQGWVNDMREIYSKTRVLLIPSLWPEPFPRVALEAMINGIPCISTGQGGLKEAIGDAGIIIDDYYNIEKWKKAIIRLDKMPYYAKLSSKSVKQVFKYNLRNQVKNFINVLNKIK